MPPLTLESIALRKAQVRADLQEKNKEMAGLLRDVFAPAAPAATRAGRWAHHLNTGLAMLDGFLFGLRVMRRMRSSFSMRSSFRKK